MLILELTREFPPLLLKYKLLAPALLECLLACITRTPGEVYDADHAFLFCFGLFDCMLISSAEEAPEELAEGETQVNNVVYSFRLVSTQFDKKSFMVYLKVSLKNRDSLFDE